MPMRNSDDAPPPDIEPVYAELRAMAQRLIARERPGVSVQATELVHEAFLRLRGTPAEAKCDRSYLVAAAAQAMRRVLVDRHRARRALKRGGGAARIPLQEEAASAVVDALDWIALDEALESLEREDTRASRVFELRFFGGLEFKAISEMLGVSPRTAERDWAYARAHLRAALDGEKERRGEGEDAS